MTSLLRSVLERRALTASSFWGYNINAATTSHSGVVVSQDTADRHSAVFGALALLSDDISTLPLKAYTTWGGSKREVPQPTWMKTPIPLDPNYTIVEFLSQVVLSLLSDGNAFIRVMPDIATKAELRVLDPQRVEVKSGSDGLPVYTLYSQVGNVSQPRYGPFEVIHISYMRKPGRARGLSPIESLSESIGAGMAAEEFSSRFYSQGANMTGVIETPQNATEISDEQAKKIKRDFTLGNTGLQNSHAVGILTGGAKMNWMTVKPSDALLIEAQQWSVEQIARAYKIPPHMLGSQQPGGQAYASVEQKSTDYVTHAVAPLCTRIETALSRLLPLNSYLEFSLQALLRADAKDRSFLYKALFDTGAASPNWIAEKENIPTFDGGDKHYIAVNNLSPIESGAGQAADAQTPDETGPQEN